ncbi:MAG: B-box zinc finger protein, partial [Candidatus Helarchaeales archaeon]
MILTIILLEREKYSSKAIYFYRGNGMNISSISQPARTEPTCNICNERVATYYCNNCNVILCSKCVKEERKKLLYCNKCGTKIMEEDLARGNSKKLKCQTCKSTSFREGVSSQKTCPSCHKTEIVSIAAKRKTFVEDFRKQLIRLMHAHETLRKIQSKARSARRNLIKLRSAAFLHDYQLETFVLEVLNALPLYIDRIQSKLSQKIPIMEQQVQKLDYLEGNGPQNFTYYDTVLTQIKDNISVFNSFVDDLVSESFEKLDYITDKISEIQNFKDKFSIILPVLNLLPEELPIAIFDNVKIKDCSLANLNNQKGYLVI